MTGMLHDCPMRGNHENLGGRRLRFPNRIDRVESIPGFLARAAADHPVPRLKAIYDEIGFDGRRQGMLQCADDGTLEKLAYVTRGPVSDLGRCAGNRVRRKVVAFGDLQVLEEQVEWSRRRIAPTTLAAHPVHRHDWLHKMLPFCPISGEPLVSLCALCGGRLGWAYTYGIANCEHCETPVPPSGEPWLGKEHAANYRLFSELVSFDASVRKHAWSTLPEELQQNSPGAAINLAIRVHRHLRDRCGTKLRSSPHTLPANELADVIDGAVALLKGWPYSVRDAVEAKVGEFGDDHAAFVSLWRRLKAMSKPKGETSIEQADLMLSALPDVARPVWRSFAPPYRVYLQQEAHSITGLKPRQLLAATTGGHLTTTQLPSAGKRNIFYKADEIDDLRLLCETTVPISTVASDLVLPNYAVEQLAASKLFEHADEPILAAVYSLPRLRRDTVRAFVGSLEKNRSGRPCPEDAAPLAKVIRMHGGDEKPWGSVFRALRNSAISFWIEGGAINARTVMVRPHDIWSIKPIGTVRNRPDALRRDSISKTDAAEILNATPSQFQRIASEESFIFDRVSRADVTSIQTIIAVARRWITQAEIEGRMNGLGRDGKWETLLAGTKRSAAGWPRSQVARLLNLD